MLDVNFNEELQCRFNVNDTKFDKIISNFTEQSVKFNDLSSNINEVNTRFDEVQSDIINEIDEYCITIVKRCV